MVEVCGVRGQLDWLLEFYFVGFLIYQLLPLDLSLSLTELWHKFKGGQIVLIPLTDLPTESGPLCYGLFRDLLTMMPVGVLATVWGMPPGKTRPWGRRLAFGLVVTVGIELLQLFVLSRFSSTTDILIGISGFALSAWGSDQWLAHSGPQSSVESGKMTAAGHALRLFGGMLYAGVVVGIFCYPFDLTNDAKAVAEAWRGFWTVPFARLYWGTEFNAASNVLSRLLYFFPLGAMGADWVYRAVSSRGWRYIGYMVVGLGTFTLGLGIELTQLFSRTRFADTTDVILYFLGGLLGLATVNWYYQRPNMAWVGDSVE